MISLPKLGYTFTNIELFTQSLTHKSYHNENPEGSTGHNEKLEFLGDSVLDLSLSSLLMENYPELDEGGLSKIRASLVNEDSLAEVAKNLHLDEYIRLGRGEEKMQGAQKPRLQASCFEAVIGAIYLDGGFLEAFKWVGQTFSVKLENINLVDFFETDYKTTLQEKIQKNYKVTPEYTLVKEEGPDHDKNFYSQVEVKGLVSEVGNGKSKKISEQMAAKKALEALS